MKLRRFPILIIAIVIISVIVVIGLYPNAPDEKNKLTNDILGYLVQFSLIAIAGGILMHEYSRQSERQKKGNELKRELYMEMLRTYFRIKRTRRILKAAMSNNEGNNQRTIEYITLREQIHDLIDGQLDYEFYKEQLQWLIEKDVFSNTEKGGKILANVNRIEDYLNKLTDPYQKGISRSQVIDIRTMNSLEDFVFNKTVFKENYADHHRNSIKLFQEEILNL